MTKEIQATKGKIMTKEIQATASAKDAALDYNINIADVVASNGKKVTLPDVEKHKKDKIGDSKSSLPDTLTETPVVEKPKPAKGKYICVHAINEDGNEFKPDDIYTGKNAKYFLSEKIIKKA